MLDPLSVCLRQFPSGKSGVFAILARSTHDQDAPRIVEAWIAICKKQERERIGEGNVPISRVNLDELLERLGMHARDLVGIINRCAYDFAIEENRAVFMTRYPKMMVASMNRAMEPTATEERRMHFQATGWLPTAKGASVNVNMNQQTVVERSEAGQAPSVSQTARRVVRALPPVIEHG